jgi:hypothetical protein
MVYTTMVLDASLTFATLVGRSKEPVDTKGLIMTKQDGSYAETDPAMCMPVVDARGSVACDALGEWGADPMDRDEPSDEPVVTTRRRLLRLSILATEVGARFAREGIGHDPAAWMLTPRMAFGGARPIEACQDLHDFGRAILLHGLGLGLDADPNVLDEFLAEDDVDSHNYTTRHPNGALH